METWIQVILHSVTALSMGGLFYFVRKRGNIKEAEERIKACLNVVESRAETLERTQENVRRKMEDGLLRLNKICEKAHGLVERGFEMGGFPASSEETDLRTIVPDERLEIPSLRELENTRQIAIEELRVSDEVILREQLS